MGYEAYFPKGIASGNSFCNRKDERLRLIKNIKSGQHTLLMSPRRYGKTSLVFYVANEANIPFGDADFFIAVNAKKIEHGIITGVKEVIASVGTPLDQVLELLRNYFKDKNTQWTIGTQGINLALVPANESDPANNILEALQALENLLQAKKKRALLFLDEIQEIGEISDGKCIEGAIRHVAQKTKYLSLVFSGSNRRLLAKMFYDKSRPLYKLCDRIVLERINEDEYVKHINGIATRTWRRDIDAAVLNMIFELTELHPYYINTLCLRLWEMETKKIPELNDVMRCWNEIIKTNRSETLRELSALSIGQRKIISLIAKGHKNDLTGKKILREVDLSSSSVIEAIQMLEQKDYIEQLDGGGYRIIDPLIKATLLFY